MFNIIGDEIVFEGTTIGRLAGGWPTLQERVRTILDCAEADMLTADEHAEAITEARDEALFDGIAKGRAEAEEEFDDKKDEIYDKGFDAGRATALVDMARASDAERVEALLTAMSEAHDTLFKVAHQRYPAAKQSELKTAARSNLEALRMALHEYRKPNGAE